MYILIPCKSFATGKSRLSECLNSSGRQDVCKELFVRTLDHATAIAAPAQIRVVTSDPDAGTIASGYSIAHISDPGMGLNAALDYARDVLLAEIKSDSAMLILPIDLPFASPDAISQLLSCSGDVVVAPDEIGTGTNVLLLRQPALRHFRFAFGPDSYAAHVSGALANDLTVETVRDWRLASDIDGPLQYAAWRSREERKQGAGD